MTKQTIAKFGALTAAVLVIPSVSFAGTEAKEVKQVVEKCKESCITGDLGINIASQYISRGVVYENQGAIIQPYADLYFRLYEGDGFLNKASLNLGIWNSFHSHHTAGQSGTTRGWYEFDFSAGVSFTFAKNFTFTPSYYSFLSPADGFDTFHGVNLKLAYDDTDLLGAFALHPYVQVLFELENKAGTGADEGVYYEIGIAPSVPVGPVTLTFPIAVGLGSSDFYVDETGSNETYGFFTAGVTASYQLKFIPECYGVWTASAGYSYYNLGDGTDYVGVDSVRDHEDNEHVFSGGLQVAF